MIADQVAHIVAGDGARAHAARRGLQARVVGVRLGLDNGFGRCCAPAQDLPLQRRGSVR